MCLLLYVVINVLHSISYSIAGWTTINLPTITIFCVVNNVCINAAVFFSPFLKLIIFHLLNYVLHDFRKEYSSTAKMA